jgi:proteasome-associated ATPase
MARSYDHVAAWHARQQSREEKPSKKKSRSKHVSKNKEGFSFFVDVVHVDVPTAPIVRWDEVIGQDEAKAALREAIEGAIKHADLYKRYGRKPTKGVLLYGPPGNGKTMLGKAAATALAEVHGGVASASGFIYVKGPELKDSYYGGTERKIRDLFERARRHKAQHGYPAVIFVDEAECMLGHRRDDGGGVSAVQTFLTEMDGLVESSAFVLLATNRPGQLDSAVIREGRIDRKILVGRPSREDAIEIFRQCLRPRPIVGDLDELAAAAAEILYDSRHALYALHLQDGTSKTVRLGDFTSGAQITSLVESATSFAIDREIATGEQGIRIDDFRAAILRSLKEQRDLDHPTELAAFCEDFMGEIVRLERVKGDGLKAKRASLITKIPEGVGVVFEPAPRTVPQC